MYVPEPFREERVGILHSAMREIGAATVVSQGASGLTASHVPIELDAEPAPWGTVRFHLARRNPQSRSREGEGELLLVFQGPQGYVSPSWYPSKARDARVVPTWNYVAIHAYGEARRIEDVDALRAHLAALTDRFEHGSETPWSLDDAPADFVDGACRAIVGFEVRLRHVEGKWKLSQNRSSEDREGVRRGLSARGGEADLAMARWIAGHE